MRIEITDGLNIVTIGYNNSICSYYKLNRPVTVTYYDCLGSVGEYLSMLPSSAAEREVLQARINADLFEDFSGREEALYETLKPLFRLFQNGRFDLSFSDGKTREQSTVVSGTERNTDDVLWRIVYPEVVDLSKTEEIKKKFREECLGQATANLGANLIYYTSSHIGSPDPYNFIATRPRSEIDPQRVAFFIEKIKQGARPFIILICTFYEPEYNHSGSFILDGHHKLEAYLKLGIVPPITYITRNIGEGDEQDFDIETMGLLLYPWQTRHILDHWEDKDEHLPGLMQNAESLLGNIVRHGECREYHDNGILKLEGLYTYDHPEGQIRGYFESGKLRFEENYKNGKQVGTQKYWYPNGQLKGISSFNESGQRHGEWLTYVETGELRISLPHTDGIPADGYAYQKDVNACHFAYEFWYKGGELVERKSYNGAELYRHEKLSVESGQLVEIPVPPKSKFS